MFTNARGSTKESMEKNEGSRRSPCSVLSTGSSSGSKIARFMTYKERLMETTDRYELIQSNINNQQIKQELKEVLVVDIRYKKVLWLEEEKDLQSDRGKDSI